ncbi:MAG: FixH family protein [Bacteroidetes bacterium]|nr:FixH family protein [Bacteroidota bacterium]
MKFNWGHGIFIFIVVFLLSMSFVVYKAFQEKNALVEDEYYPKGLEYQKQIDRIANADSMSEKITIGEKNGTVLLTYPAIFRNKSCEGIVYFYRPSDDAGDLKLAMVIDNTLQQKVEENKLLSGKYTVKMNWKLDGKEYYHEESLLISH